MIVRALDDADQPGLGHLVAVLAAEPRRFGRRASPKPPSGWRSRLAHPASLHGAGAFEEGVLIGVARLVPAGAGRDELLVAVAPDHRGSGLGTVLVGAALELAAARGARAVVAAVERRNRAAMALSRRLGCPVLALGGGRVEVVLQHESFAFSA
jgi:GNAT superfamily N-acetyltransferase